jgi:hypothetical protein
MACSIIDFIFDHNFSKITTALESSTNRSLIKTALESSVAKSLIERKDTGASIGSVSLR